MDDASIELAPTAGIEPALIPINSRTRAPCSSGWNVSFCDGQFATAIRSFVSAIHVGTVHIDNRDVDTHYTFRGSSVLVSHDHDRQNAYLSSSVQSSRIGCRASSRSCDAHRVQAARAARCSATTRDDVRRRTGRDISCLDTPQARRRVRRGRSSRPILTHLSASALFAFHEHYDSVVKETCHFLSLGSALLKGTALFFHWSA